MGILCTLVHGGVGECHFKHALRNEHPCDPHKSGLRSVAQQIRKATAVLSATQLRGSNRPETFTPVQKRTAKMKGDRSRGVMQTQRAHGLKKGLQEGGRRSG